MEIMFNILNLIVTISVSAATGIKRTVLSDLFFTTKNALDVRFSLDPPCDRLQTVVELNYIYLVVINIT